MITKFLISADIEVLTGLHIGGSNAFSAIGAVDSVVVRDPLTTLPIIPGSSLKGKMRYLLAKNLHAIKNPGKKFEYEPNDDDHEVKRMFGSSDKPIIKARLKFNDCFMQNAEELQKRRISPTEVKFENTISRKSCDAKPRQVERVVKGSVFKMELFYEVQEDLKVEVEKDFENLKAAFRLLEFDYLGGHGTRGSGRIKFSNLRIECANGSFASLDELNSIFGKSDAKDI